MAPLALWLVKLSRNGRTALRTCALDVTAALLAVGSYVWGCLDVWVTSRCLQDDSVAMDPALIADMMQAILA
jgi:hypothetical protein